MYTLRGKNIAAPHNENINFNISRNFIVNLLDYTMHWVRVLGILKMKMFKIRYVALNNPGEVNYGT